MVGAGLLGTQHISCLHHLLFLCKIVFGLFFAFPVYKLLVTEHTHEHIAPLTFQPLANLFLESSVEHNDLIDDL